MLPLLCGALLLAGCTVQSGRLSSASLYDLGPLPAVTTAPAAVTTATAATTAAATTAGATPAAQPSIAISVAEVTPSAWLDSPLMFYRLLYADAQQPRAYAQQRWIMQPTELFGQRLKARIVQAGGVAASAVDGPSNLSLLKIEADDFTHVFDSPEHSYGSIALRASLYNGRALVAQKSFAVRAPARSNDAAGAARALAAASDTVIADMLAWLARQPLKR
ncbi:ABC transporter [Noviherbaspirillum sedimenti]|uniref:ABC transporter n=2 Tax=Noviherbaspirillum sedimenti TaxID=2320865 RepID=A0A3A3GQ74_9BURK|nr:ABC transporter [Noviherbaspirillum sedimenti]